jgi:2-methylcitrate dehydratase
MQKHQIDKKDVAEVKIRTVARAADILSDPSKYDPRTRETADHSLPYCIAATIVDGTVTPESFSEQKIMDPEIRSYLNKIKVIADPDYEKTFPELKKAGLEITTTDNNKFEIEVNYPLGDYREPMDDTTLNSKFDSMVLPETGQKKRDKIADMIWDLEKLDDVAVFAELMSK